MSFSSLFSKILPWNRDPSSLFLSNTLGGKKEAFHPLQSGKAKLYHCGPTVYNFAHIGNLRPYVFADILRRTLERKGFKVEQVINITDVGHLSGDTTDSGEDKMVLALKREGKELTRKNMLVLGDFYAKSFLEDLETLNILLPHHLPKASEHIAEDIALIQRLFDTKVAYKISDGVYFDTQADKQYGRLGHLADIDQRKEQARVPENKEKRDKKDFALWKLDTLGWESPWGKGFPGWHIECSAMSMKYLGETFDIHTGGIDHIPIHHNNEIAQSEMATGKILARYWLHSAHITFDGEKISKSKGNVYYLKDLTEKKYSSLSLRYFFLTARYQSPLSFNLEALESSQNALFGILRSLSSFPEGGRADGEWLRKFDEVISDDLDTPKGIALLFDCLRSNLSDKNKLATILEFDTILGLNLAKERKKFSKLSDVEIPIQIKNLLTEREHARAKKDFARADALRTEIESLGFLLKDSSDGVKLTKK